MKLKNWIVWLLVVVFLVSEVLLFSANRQKNTALDSLRDAQQQVVDLSAQVEQLKSDMATAQNVEVNKLRADNLDLPRLRNQVTQLQAANQKLQADNLKSQAANQKLNEQMSSALTQLRQVVVENQQVRAVAQQRDAEAARNQCINNLRQIDAAKTQWALENNKTATAVPTATDLAPYIKLDANGYIPGCPSGGTYTIGAVGVSPTCSLPGHVLP